MTIDSSSEDTVTIPPLLSPPARFIAIAVCMLVLCGAQAHAQFTPSADAYTNSTSPSTNFGAQPVLDVQSASQTAYIQFDLSALPSSYTGANITKATLKLYVNAVTDAGSFNVDFVNGAWAEGSITSNLAPALGTTIAPGVPLSSTNVHDYIIIDITSALQAWLDGSEPNDGIALVGNSPLNASFDSKESTTQSHPPELDIVFAAGGGSGITGIVTASGSGLIGGGTSGNLNLSLTHSCGTKQILQWSGSAWVCSAAASGTITRVTAGTDLTGGGSGGNVTLNVDTTKVAQLAAANTFTGNQTVNGNLSATGVVTGSSYLIGSDLFAFGSFANANAFVGFAGNSTMTGTSNTAVGRVALFDDVDGYYNTAIGAAALYSNSSGYNNIATGNYALTSNTIGYENSATGAYALTNNTTGIQNTAEGRAALYFNTTGSSNTGLGFNAGHTVDLSNITGSNGTFIGADAVPSTGTLTNTTAIGANAEVTASNALVLGSINGVNNATADTLVGIGITAPNYKLHVGNFKNSFRVEGPMTSGTGGVAGSFGGFGDFGIDANGTVNGRFVVKESGRVGIGTAAPDSLLTVNGSADKPGGGSWGTFSDGRLKTLSGDFQSGLTAILKLHPIRYRYKEGNGMGITDHDEHVGFVAQDVQKVIPEAVNENSAGYLLVNNDPIIWAMLNAIKEQQGQIKRQQSRLRTQAAAMRSLEAEVRETRETVRKVKAERAISQLTSIASK
jgi:hypothetical protein